MSGEQEDHDKWDQRKAVMQEQVAAKGLGPSYGIGAVVRLKYSVQVVRESGKFESGPFFDRDMAEKAAANFAASPNVLSVTITTTV